MPERKKARRRWNRLGPRRVHLRFACNLTLEQYAARKAWLEATLRRCPMHPEGGCGLASHGTYERLHPVRCLGARYDCAGHVTFSLVPECLAAGMMGTLGRAEQSAAAVEQGVALEPMAYDIRPPGEVGDPDAIVEPATVVQRTKRRHRSVVLDGRR